MCFRTFPLNWDTLIFIWKFSWVLRLERKARKPEGVKRLRMRVRSTNKARAKQLRMHNSMIMHNSLIKWCQIMFISMIVCCEKSKKKIGTRQILFWSWQIYQTRKRRSPVLWKGSVNLDNKHYPPHLQWVERVDTKSRLRCPSRLSKQDHHIGHLHSRIMGMVSLCLCK